MIEDHPGLHVEAAGPNPRTLEGIAGTGARLQVFEALDRKSWRLASASAENLLGNMNFEVPPELEAGEPPEARGLRRDEVRLMVSHRGGGQTLHVNFQQLPDLLEPGDVLVINTSRTRNAAVRASRKDGSDYNLHLSTRLPDGLWIVEMRREQSEGGTIPYRSAQSGDRLGLPSEAEAILIQPYLPPSQQAPPPEGGTHLWVASLDLPGPVDDYLETYGFPIRYRHVRKAWPMEYYQTVYAREVGSAEMPSAGRAFSPEVITRLVARGVLVVPLVLHTGVSTLEVDELPQEEFYKVPEATASAVNAARERGSGVIAVGTTVVRALETVVDPDGSVRPGEGWTDLVVTPERGIHVVDGMLTGFHESGSSHLSMLVALLGQLQLGAAYEEALQARYLWHEFGDLHLILP